MIRRAISQFNWDQAFSNTNVNEKVYIFSLTILNILSNFISHEYIMCETHHDSAVRQNISYRKKTMPISYIEIIKLMLVLEID